MRHPYSSVARAMLVGLSLVFALLVWTIGNGSTARSDPSKGLRQAGVPACLGFVVPATPSRGSSFLGLAVSYSRPQDVEALLGKPTAIDTPLNARAVYRWHGQPWLSSLGLRELGIFYAHGVIATVHLELDRPARSAPAAWGLGVGAPPLTEILESGGRYEMHGERGVGLLRSAQGEVLAIGLREFTGAVREVAPDAPPDALSYVQVGSDRRPPSFLGLRCGVVHVGHLRALFGDPDEVPSETDRLWSRSAWIRRAGLRRLRSRMTADGTILRLQLDLVRPAPYRALRDHLGLTDPWREEPHRGGATIRIHSRQGVLMTLERASVSELLLYVDPSVTPTPMAAPDSARDAEPGPSNAPVGAGHLAAELHDAVQARDAERVRELLREGADVDGRRPTTRDAPIHVATRLRDADVLRVLVDGGADLDVRREDGTTALHIASVLDDTATAELLLGAGADPRIRDVDGLRARDLARRRDVVRLLESAEQAIRQRPHDPAARRAVNGYMEAVVTGDTAAMARWTAGDAEPAADDPVRPLPATWEIQEIESGPRRGRATLNLRPEGLPEGHEGLPIELTLVRRARAWAVSEVRVSPHPAGGDHR